MSRDATGLRSALDDVRALRAEFWSDLRIAGGADQLNQELERAGRVADYLELAELMCIDALDRDESCGAHFRAEHQTSGGEAVRNDDQWRFTSAWEPGADGVPVRRAEPLEFARVPLRVRDYR